MRREDPQTNHGFTAQEEVPDVFTMYIFSPESTLEASDDVAEKRLWTKPTVSILTPVAARRLMLHLMMAFLGMDPASNAASGMIVTWRP